VSLSSASIEDVIEAIGRDKKRTSAGLPFVLVREPGDVRLDAGVPGDAVRAAVEELTR
jgi:3-dehydroquinate synthetase